MTPYDPRDPTREPHVRRSFPIVEITLDEITALADYAYKQKLTGGNTTLRISRNTAGVAELHVEGGHLYRLTPRAT